MRRWFGSYYFARQTDTLNPYASPILGDVTGLTPTTVITERFDPLRDEGAGYADKLRNGGITVNCCNFETGTHESFGMGPVSMVAQSEVQLVANDLRAAF